MRRVSLHVYMSADAKAAWRKIADDNDVTVSGLIEAVGRVLGRDDLPAPAEWCADAIELARQVDRENRRRG